MRVEHIHWHEGLFLQPHHLQQAQLSITTQIVERLKNVCQYPYGLIAADLNIDALESFIIQFNSICAVMPSGRTVLFPGNSELPAKNIKTAYEKRHERMTLYLALPIYSSAEGNTDESLGEDGPVLGKQIFRVVEKEVRDENTGDNPQMVQFRKYNARLVLDSDDHTDLELLPLMRVDPASEESNSVPLKINQQFIPPSLQLTASTVLRAKSLEMLDLMKAAREDMVAQLNRAGFNPELLSGVQLERVLRLQVLNKYCGWVDSVINVDPLHPFAFYLKLREMLGELAALQPARDLFAVPSYNHEDCHPIFHELFSRIRSLLASDESGSYVKIDFTHDEGSKNVWFAELRDEHILKAEDYFLAVQNIGDPRQLVNALETGDQFKLIAPSQVDQRIRGIKLKEERYPPSILPAIPDALFFKLLRADSSRSWSRIRDEKKISAVWSESVLPRIKVTLFITTFDKEGNK
ncbi:MAG: type VI secretion system baseplate subunit TssK [Kiritimatiellaeota bacterium]|nr:type VI secretion system baseplate subunit TssK [Kiritimatiellota bacterium]